MGEKKDKALKILDESRAVMRKVLERIEKNREIYPTWTIKQMLSHIAGWDEALAASLTSYMKGKPPQTMAYQGVDAYNANSVSTREELDLEHVIREWEFERQKVRGAVEGLTEEQMDDTIVYPWGGEGSIYSLVLSLAYHELNHAKEVQEQLHKN